MTVKSVIEIDVLDEKFKAFQEAFNKYKKAVDDQSKKWKEVNKALEESEKRQKAFNKAVQDGGQALKSAVVYSASVARNMASAAMSAAKWIAYASIGGGFGLGGLAASASNLRREATGLGLNTSQLRAARTYGEPYLGGIEGVMSNIQRLQTTLTEQYKVGILGGNLNKNAFQNLPDILTRARQAMFDAGGNIDVARNMTPGLQDVLNEEQLQTVANMKPEEFARMITSLQTGERNFAVDEAKYESFRKFWVSLKEAGNKIENSLIKNLDKLTEPLSKLSESVVKALDAFLGSKKAQQALEDFAEYLASDKFKENVQTFFTALERLGEATYNAAVFLGLVDKKNQATPEDIEKARKQLPSWLPDYAVKGVAQSNRDLLSKIDPKLAKSIEMAGLNPISGLRTEAEQKVLYDAWIANGKKGNLVAEPGKSTHQFGKSVDVTMASLNKFLSENSEKDLQDKYNLYRPHGSKDPNHLELYNPNRTDIYVHFDGASRKAAPMAGKQ
jgi:LAS superfamily LD-carboxypeptidase LdcB